MSTSKRTRATEYVQSRERMLRYKPKRRSVPREACLGAYFVVAGHDTRWYPWRITWHAGRPTLICRSHEATYVYLPLPIDPADWHY